MKKYLICLIAAFLLAWSSFALAQDKRTSKNISTNGFWVVESNKKSPRSSIIYFYNNQQVLVYKEQIEGRKLNISRVKVQRKLKHVLETAVVAWEKDRILRENEQLVMLALKD